MSGIDLDSYVGVNERLVELREKHPDASLQPVNLDAPYEIVTVEGKFFIVYAAACYRTPDDTRPGIGVAWEPVPGKTSFTRDSELQNAETSAWGRAIVAALAADTKRGVASADEVRNRPAESVPEASVDLANLTLDDVDTLRPRDLFAALGVQGGNVVEAREQLRAKLAEVGSGLGEVPEPAEAHKVAEGGKPGQESGSGSHAPALVGPDETTSPTAPGASSASVAGEGASTLGEDPDAPLPSANRRDKVATRNRLLYAQGISVAVEKKKRGLPDPKKATDVELDAWEALQDELQAEADEKAAALREHDERVAP